MPLRNGYFNFELIKYDVPLIIFNYVVSRMERAMRLRS